ncbi:BFH_collapsed_G0052720.mRNA.1.CDS.1 [Saccharomyces cerevisiae]|nr:BFH_collapsed_G0052720.mRNA.1.CDS.1 [Saccharomyces cerevisiae]
MTMYPNSPANSSVYPKTSASIALTNKLKRRRKWWKSTKQRLGVLLYGSSYTNKANLSNNKINKGFSKVKKFNMENDIKNKQNRDMIWKWLIEDKKN